MSSLPSSAGTLIGNLLEFARDRGKPVMIAEATPQGYDLVNMTRANITPTWDGPAGENVSTVTADQVWDEWFAPLFHLMNKHRDVIRALAYINCHWDSQDMWDAPYESGYWGDSRVQASPLIARRFSDAVVHWQKQP